jgi:hypothetical protein
MTETLTRRAAKHAPSGDPSHAPGWSSAAQTRRNARVWWVLYAIVMGAGLFVAAVAYKRSTQLYLGVAAGALLLLLALWTRFPRVALGATIGLALVGDQVTVRWFPFNKNLSSRESIFYITDALSVNPLEMVLVFGLVTVAYRNYVATGRPLRSAPLVWPFVIFLGFVLFGLVNGIGTGGDLRIAIFEARPLIYLPLLYVLIVNVCETRADYRRMFWAALTAIFVQSLLSLYYLGSLPAAVRDGLEDLNEHGSSIGMNLLFVMLIGSLVYRKIPTRLTFIFLFASIPVMVVYLVSQRRAAIVALGAAMMLLAVTLLWRQRRTFWKDVPIAVLLTAGYVGAFWNSETSAGFPAQAIKTVVAPDEATEKDQSSDLYREIERFDLHYTIRDAPLTGQGFGQPFLRPVPLPDISSFEFHEYLPHNSLLWVWIKTGFFGFVALLYVLARAIMLGVDRYRRTPAGVNALIGASSLFFIVMYSVFLYVEIAWEPRNVTLLALAMAACTGPLLEERSSAVAEGAAEEEPPDEPEPGLRRSLAARLQLV